MNPQLQQKIDHIHGPILVLGASGFIGANLFRTLFEQRRDVFGTTSHFPAWRLEGLPEENVIAADLLVESNLKELLDKVRPETVFNCVAYGAYSFEKDPELIYRSNLNFTVRLLEEFATRGIRSYIHAGSSSEYGANAAAPTEETATTPNSHYAVSKAAAAQAIYYMGTERGLPCANLRLYSVYGPYEDPSRLIPTIIAKAERDELPELVRPDISRDFVYVHDVCEAFIDTTLNLSPEHYGHSFNIGSGECTTIGQLAEEARALFAITAEPRFTMPQRDWDVSNWYANPEKAQKVLGWRTRTSLKQGLEQTRIWYRNLEDKEFYLASSKKRGLNLRHSVSAIIACYNDGQAIPIMYKRLTQVFRYLKIDYEIIFINDCSPDDSEEVIRDITSRDRRVIGISHSRNFGSQAAFRSGMEIASKNACVLLDGDLQDPPELIERFVERWREGYDVVYGRRVKREAHWLMQLAYKLFYRVFDYFSYIRIPHDAGDFSLIDKRVMRCLLQFPERDLFLRGVRAFAGFRQTGVDYKRPERMFGVSTNNLFKNLGWAKKGILSFSNTPLNLLTAFSFGLFGVVMVLVVLQVLAKLLYPEIAPKGVTTLMLTVMFFGSTTLLALSLLGEYIAKIFEEVKRRPHFLRRNIIRDGEIRDAAEELEIAGREIR